MDLNKIYLGDCLELMPQLADESIDMILCDLPYGTTACKWDTIIPFDKLWAEYERIIKPNGAIVLTASQPFTSALVMSNPKMFKYEWIWEKHTGSNFAQLKRMPFKQHENILVFGKAGWSNYNPQMQPKSESTKDRLKYDISGMIKGNATANKHSRGYSDEMRTSEDRYPSSVQKFNRQTGLHPTQKPVPLFEYLIRTYTNEGETVLDNCIGSGTTAIACKQTGRNFIGIEMEQEYFDIATKRLNESHYCPYSYGQIIDICLYRIKTFHSGFEDKKDLFMERGIERLNIPHKYDDIGVGNRYFSCRLDDTVTLYNTEGKFLFECTKYTYCKEGLFLVGNRYDNDNEKEFGYALYNEEKRLTDPIFSMYGMTDAFNSAGFKIA